MFDRYTVIDDEREEEDLYSDDYPLGGSVEPYDIDRDNELTI